jgi:glutaredoxin 3
LCRNPSERYFIPLEQKARTVPPITIYTTPLCPYCVRAKRLLTAKGASFEEIDVMMDPDQRRNMEVRSGRHTVPQIFFADTHIGGCDDLFRLEEAGQLDALLQDLPA